nr:MAG TPA: hypothetical protein [Caudoviricetes sp.]
MAFVWRWIPRDSAHSFFSIITQFRQYLYCLKLTSLRLYSQ